MKYDIATTARFEKDLKTAKKRGLDLDELDGVVTNSPMGRTCLQKITTIPWRANTRVRVNAISSRIGCLCMKKQTA